jgi:hypothetical protein
MMQEVHHLLPLQWKLQQLVSPQTMIHQLQQHLLPLQPMLIPGWKTCPSL